MLAFREQGKTTVEKWDLEGDPGQLLIPLRKTRKMDPGFLFFPFLRQGFM